jgi:hypothetical protein
MAETPLGIDSDFLGEEAAMAVSQRKASAHQLDAQAPG